MKKTVAELAQRLLERNSGTLSDVEKRILQSAIDRTPVSVDTNAVYSTTQNVGDRIADKIAQVGGSWTFIISFIVFLVVWTMGNVLLLGRAQFDPYPFIFLNLILSMIAALQAPVIMMSQNRMAARDRLEATHDYEVNLMAEVEIRLLFAPVVVALEPNRPALSMLTRCSIDFFRCW